LSLLITAMLLSQIALANYSIQYGDVVRTITDNGLNANDYNTKTKERTVSDALGAMFQHFNADGRLDLQYNKDATGTVTSVMQFNPNAQDPSKAYTLTVYNGAGNLNSVTLGGYSMQDLAEGTKGLEQQAGAIFATFLAGGVDAVNALGSDVAKHITGFSLKPGVISGMSDAQIIKLFGFKSDGSAGVSAEVAKIRALASKAGVDGTIQITMASKDGKISVSKYEGALFNGLPAGDKGAAAGETPPPGTVPSEHDYGTMTVADYNNLFANPISIPLGGNAQTVVNGAAAWGSLSPAQQNALTAFMHGSGVSFANLTQAQINTVLGAGVTADVKEKLFAAVHLLGGEAWGNAPQAGGFMEAAFASMVTLAHDITSALSSSTGQCSKLTVNQVRGSGSGLELTFSQNSANVGSSNNPTQNVAHLIFKVDSIAANDIDVTSKDFGNAHNVGSYDPLVSGTISRIVNINGVNYAVVKASTIDMYDGKGPQKADGEEIFVAVDEATAASFKSQLDNSKTGVSICIAGNVTDKVNGKFTMTMNQGGYTTAEGSNPESVAKVASSWKASHQTFYNTMLATMAPVWAVANATGHNSDWKSGWNFLSGSAGKIIEATASRIAGFFNR